MKQDFNSLRLSQDAVLSEFERALVEGGLKRFSKHNIGLDFGGGFSLWIGTPCKKMPDNSFEVFINIGVHCAPIERMWTTLKGGKVKYSRSVATYSVPFIVNDEQVFGAVNIDNIREKINSISAIVAEQGIPVARSLANYEALLARLETRIGMLGAYPERFACCLFLLGRHREAKDFIDKFNRSRPGYLGDLFESFMDFS